MLKAIAAPTGAQWAVQAEHPTLGAYYSVRRHAAKPLYTRTRATRSAVERSGATPYVKDAFHRRIVNGEEGAVNPDMTGTKFGAWHTLNVDAGHSVTIGLTLSRAPLASPFRQA
jgi:hypothetical protein